MTKFFVVLNPTVGAKIKINVDEMSTYECTPEYIFITIFLIFLLKLTDWNELSSGTTGNVEKLPYGEVSTQAGSPCQYFTVIS